MCIVVAAHITKSQYFGGGTFGSLPIFNPYDPYLPPSNHDIIMMYIHVMAQPEAWIMAGDSHFFTRKNRSRASMLKFGTYKSNNPLPNFSFRCNPPTPTFNSFLASFHAAGPFFIHASTRIDCHWPMTFMTIYLGSMKRLCIFYWEGRLLSVLSLGIWITSNSNNWLMSD